MTEEVQEVQNALSEDATTQEPVENEVQEADAEGTEIETEAKKPSDSSTDKKKSGVQERIDELTKYWRSTERERDYWREMAMKAQQLKEPEAPKETPKPVAKTLADFDYDEQQYQQYLFSEATKSAIEAAKRELRADQEQKTKQQRVASFNSKEESLAKDNADYMQVTRSIPLTEESFEVISDMEEGPAVLYYLGKNPEIARVISQLTPIAAARELGKIEAKLSIKPQAAKVSSAPPPPPKIAATTHSSPISAASPDSDKLSTDEWLRRREKQLKGK